MLTFILSLLLYSLLEADAKDLSLFRQKKQNIVINAGG